MHAARWWWRGLGVQFRQCPSRRCQGVDFSGDPERSAECHAIVFPLILRVNARCQEAAEGWEAVDPATAPGRGPDRHLHGPRCGPQRSPRRCAGRSARRCQPTLRGPSGIFHAYLARWGGWGGADMRLGSTVWTGRQPTDETVVPPSMIIASTLIISSC